MVECRTKDEAFIFPLHCKHVHKDPLTPCPISNPASSREEVAGTKQLYPRRTPSAASVGQTAKPSGETILGLMAIQGKSAAMAVMHEWSLRLGPSRPSPGLRPFPAANTISSLFGC